MPKRPSRNVVGKYLEFDPDVAARVEEFARARNQSFRSVVMEALARHMANPPPLPAEVPLPPVPPPGRARRKRPGKGA